MVSPLPWKYFSSVTIPVANIFGRTRKPRMIHHGPQAARCRVASEEAVEVCIVSHRLPAKAS
jgi:hypothetical protein